MKRLYVYFIFLFPLCLTAQNCPEVIDLRGTQTIIGVYQADDQVVSNSVVEMSTDAMLQAGQQITLEAGFHARSGSTFTASIANCPAPDPDNFCGTAQPTQQELDDLSTLMDSLRMVNGSGEQNTTLQVRVQFTVVRRDDGTFDLGTVIDNNKINTYMTQLNQDFAAADIEFILCGTTYLDNTALSIQGARRESYLNSQVDYPDAVNIYVIQSLRGGFSGLAPLPRNDDNYILLRAFTLDQSDGVSILTHEMGHFLGLLHTFQSHNEQVDRTNCNTTGDMMCDTPADRNCDLGDGVGNINEPCTGIDFGCVTYDAANCTYTGSCVDDIGTPLNPDVNNFMSYYRPCRNSFSTEQIWKMRNALEAEPNRTNFLIGSCVANEVIQDQVEFEDSSEGVPATFTMNFIRANNSFSDQRPTATDASGNLRYTVKSDEDSHITFGRVPFYEGDWTDGVTTFDIVRIRQHLLGTNPFTKGYQFIAANVTSKSDEDDPEMDNVNDEDINAISDLIVTRTNKFENYAAPWRFVAEYVPRDFTT
ncbi:MAG: 3-coathanger stack domain-containing protein, partial [Bacteroidota bacterium]